MKHILLILAAFITLTVQRAHAISLEAPYFSEVRSEITNQLTIASNAPSLDKKLITSLRKALTLIDKADPDNLVKDTKTLTLLASTLNKSSVSNAFDSHLQTVVNIYYNVLLTDRNSLSNRLLATFPSGPHNAAQNNLNQLFTALQNAFDAVDSGLAAKTLSLAAKKAAVTEKLTIKAENANPPKTTLTATISGAINGTYKAQAAPATFLGANHYTVTAVKAGRTGQTTVELDLVDAVAGTSTIALNGNSSYKILSLSGFQNYVATSGSATITVNTDTEAVFGTFTFNANGPEGAITVTGSFFSTY
jgi:hypothetical protein